MAKRLNQKIAQGISRACWVSVMAAVFMLFTIQAPHVNAQGTASVVISPAVRNISVGAIGSIDVLVNDYTDTNPAGANPNGLEGADIEITFDPTIVAVQDDISFQPGIQVTPGPLLGSGFYFMLQNTADNSTGTIRFIISQLHPTPPAVCPPSPTPCSGVLLTIRFAGLANGSSPVNFTMHTLGNPNGWEILSTATNGTINVSTPTASTVTQFNGTYTRKNQARLKWETGNEAGLIGFNLWQSQTAATGYNKINSAVIPAQSPGEVKANTYKYLDAGFSNSQKSWYKLEALIVGGASEWSGPVSIAAGCSAIPDKPTLTAPRDGQAVPQNVTLNWANVPCADSYQIQLRRDSLNGTALQTFTATASKLTTRVRATHIYYWRVRVVAGQRLSEWSEWRSFTVRQRTGR